jgi:hypothetical protein
VSFPKTYQRLSYTTIPPTPDGSYLLGYQLKPDNVDDFLVWANFTAYRLAGGGLLLYNGEVIFGTLELGDYLIKGDDLVWIEIADGFTQRLAEVEPPA